MKYLDSENLYKIHSRNICRFNNPNEIEIKASKSIINYGSYYEFHNKYLNTS